MDNEGYSWKVHLLRRSGWKAVVLFPALLMAGLWGLYLGGLHLFFLAILVLILALRDFLFPLTYQLSPNGVRMKGLFLKRETSWGEVKEITRERGVIRLRIGRGPFHSSACWLVLHLEGNEEEIWKRIESWRRNY